MMHCAFINLILKTLKFDQSILLWLFSAFENSKSIKLKVIRTKLFRVSVKKVNALYFPEALMLIFHASNLMCLRKIILT